LPCGSPLGCRCRTPGPTYQPRVCFPRRHHDRHHTCNSGDVNIIYFRDMETGVVIFGNVNRSGRTYTHAPASLANCLGGGSAAPAIATASAIHRLAIPLPHKSHPISFFGIDCVICWRYRWGINTGDTAMHRIVRGTPARYMVRTISPNGRRYSPDTYHATRGNAGLAALANFSPFVARVEIVKLDTMRIVQTLA